jgi:hypothetical protein
MKGDVFVVYGEKLAGVGFWLHGDRVGGTLFDDPVDVGARHLAAWGLLWDGRLPPRTYFCGPNDRAIVLQCAQTTDAPIHALIDRVVDRRLHGPTELTLEELKMLFPTPPDPGQLLGVQRMLQKVGITWPGSPEIPELPPQSGKNPFTGQPM